MRGRPYVLMVCNRKGGTGKTTTAVNLAAELAARERRVLLVDLDTQGHAALGVGLPAPEKGTPTVHGLFGDPDRRLADAVRPTGYDRLWAAPADPLFDGIGVPGDPGRLARELRGADMAEAFDIVVLDTPPSLDIVSTNAMVAAHDVLIPVVPHALGLEGVHQLIRLIFRTASDANPDLRLLGLLPVMLDARVNLHRTIMQEIVKHFGAMRVFRGIRSDIRLAEAFHARQPIRAFAPKCRGALDYHHLADELARHWAGTPPRERGRP